MLFTVLLALHLNHGAVLGNVSVEEGWHEGHRVQLVLRAIPGGDGTLKLEAGAADAYMAMLEAATKDGVYLDTQSSFRDMSEQFKLHRQKPHLAAPAGWSNHQSGVAVDIGNTLRRGTKTGVYWWLARNARQFGFRQPMSWEPWHWEWSPGAC